MGKFALLHQQRGIKNRKASAKEQKLVINNEKLCIEARYVQDK